jgi:aryl-alcohol dehydrogenase-like predicted oxidoreductase
MESTLSGISGKNISRIGLGCVTFGREIDEKASFAMMDHALEQGITFFDTASAYSNGLSEKITGKWLKSRIPESGPVIIATKILPPFNPEHIMESVNRSLCNLRTDVIDLVYFHCWDPALKNPEAHSAIDTLISQGKILMTGASNFTADQIEYCLFLEQQSGLRPIRFLQNNNNLAVRDVNESLKSICSVNDIFIITYSPLGAGFLTGKHQNGVAAGTRFEIIPGHRDVYFNDTAFRRLSKLKAVSDRTGYSQVHLALAWALNQKGITSVLTGGRTPAHIDQAIAALSFHQMGILDELESE